MIDYNAIITAYYTPGTPLYRLLMQHSSQVADKAIDVAQKCRIKVDFDFIYEATMLHDIGIIHTHAPSIFCNGTLKYITHGIIGREMLLSAHLPTHALVCERHTGAGISVEDIIAGNLPLPHRDMLPISIEEKIICYADKFYSKSTPEIEKTIPQIRKEMEKYGAQSLARFEALHTLFSH